MAAPPPAQSRGPPLGAIPRRRRSRPRRRLLPEPPGFRAPPPSPRSRRAILLSCPTATTEAASFPLRGLGFRNGIATLRPGAPAGTSSPIGFVRPRSPTPATRRNPRRCLAGGKEFHILEVLFSKQNQIVARH